MDYYEYNFSISPTEVFTDILISHLADKGFESFSETGDGVLAYVQEKMENEEEVKKIITEMEGQATVSYFKTLIRSRNWNAEWESSFSPVEISDQCYIRAPFHAEKPGFRYEVVIEPKMSFGTGHHDTTWLMAKNLLEIDVKGKDVLDMGCGTGILAILASMAGAKSVLAIDNNDNAYENSVENVSLNGTGNVDVEKGDASLLADRSFHVILANINRNVLLNDIPAYSKVLKSNGDLLLSGFFETDISSIRACCEENNLAFLKEQIRNSWAVLHFKKNSQ